MNKRTSSVIQRMASAKTIASDDFQAWLRHQNAQKFEVYISMNALQPGARGRTKADVAVIRHIYLDFDEHGTESVRQLFQRQDLPVPSHVINTSPDKWQVTWRVQGFAKDEAEQLQRALARETGADPAATDCARVLRLPGFFNHKYARPHLVRVEPMRPERALSTGRTTSHSLRSTSDPFVTRSTPAAALRRESCRPDTFRSRNAIGPSATRRLNPYPR